MLVIADALPCGVLMVTTSDGLAGNSLLVEIGDVLSLFVLGGGGLFFSCWAGISIDLPDSICV